jgi:hypothetical protein
MSQVEEAMCHKCTRTTATPRHAAGERPSGHARIASGTVFHFGRFVDRRRENF